MYDTNFDSQKLMYHPREVGRWLQEGTTRGPVYTEMELCSKCNCRCIFCGVDYLVNKTDDVIDAPSAERVLAALHEIGNKAVMFSGHGEPLLNGDAERIVRFASERMSTSVTTNGIALTADVVGLIDGLEWVRFSINGCDADNYAQVHGVAPAMFERVLANVAGAVERKRKLGLDVVIGTQLVLLDENADGVLTLAERVKDIGVDYFSVKPYSQHPLSENRLTIDYAQYAELGDRVRALEGEAFRVVFRAGSMAKVRAHKPYRRCYGTHFLCFIAATGDVWECNVFVGDPRFRIGNALTESLADLWAGERRGEVVAFVENELDVDECRDICRMDECNKYLWRLKHPWPHDNFV